MGKITDKLHKQITGWRVYSVIAPAVFTAVSAWLYLHYGTPFQSIFFTGVIVLSITCIAWWHWSLSTMLSMLLIMKDTDDHFETVTTELQQLRTGILRPDLKIVTNPVDNNK
jgi:hypothetical protein